MYIKVRVNKDDEKTLFLCNWNASVFEADPVLRIQSDDLRTVKDIFETITCIEIFQNEALVAEYSVYDTYSDINYAGKVFVEHENIFTDCLVVRLKKRNLAEQVERLDKQINPVYDMDSMTVEELKEYKLKQISAAGETDVFSGDRVTFKDGTSKTYTFNAEDQRNLQTYLGLIAQIPDKSTIQIAYHATDEICREYSAEDIVTIYFTLQAKLLYVQTYVNMLRNYIKTLSDKTTIKAIEYGTVLPQEYQLQMQTIMQTSLAAIEELKKYYGIDTVTPEPEGETEPEEPENPVEPEPEVDDGNEEEPVE